MIEISRYLEEAGLPRGAHQVITGGRDTGEALVAAEGVQMVATTGSTAAGRRILEVAARTLKRVIWNSAATMPPSSARTCAATADMADATRTGLEPEMLRPAV